MSPGVTFERVYHELKRMLAEGELAPGTPIEPALIGRQIASSITPVRDALHRLTGERLVEAPNHNGFRVPLPTEAALRDLYAWNAQLLWLASRRMGSSVGESAAVGSQESEGLAVKIDHLFVEIARAAGSSEHVRAVQHTNARLAPYRRAERRVLDSLEEEYLLLVPELVAGNGTRLAKLLHRYHRRRLRAAAHILAAISAGERTSAS